MEVECLTKEIEETERKWRELEEAELEKEKLEEEKRVEQQCAAALCGLERAVEQRRAALTVLPPEAVFWNLVKTLVLRYNTSISTCTVNEDRGL